MLAIFKYHTHKAGYCVRRGKMFKEKGKNKEILYYDMGQRLKRIRTDNQYTQEQMAELLQLSTAYYGKVERGQYGLSLEKILLVSQKMEVDINYLFTGYKSRTFTIEDIIEKCPKDKRYDFEQLIRYALRLAKTEDDDD